MSGNGTERDNKGDDTMRTICQIFAKRDQGNGAEFRRMQVNIKNWIDKEVVSKGGRIAHVLQSSHDSKGYPVAITTIIAELP